MLELIAMIVMNAGADVTPPRRDHYIGVGLRRSCAWVSFPVRHPIKFVNKCTYPARHPLVFARRAGETIEPYQPFLNAVESATDISLPGLLLKR